LTKLVSSMMPTAWGEVLPMRWTNLGPSLDGL
jgi:hypothetical protein